MAIVQMNGDAYPTDGGSPADGLMFSRDLYRSVPNTTEAGKYYPADGPFGTGAWAYARHNNDFAYSSFPTIGPTFFAAAWIKQIGSINAWTIFSFFESGQRWYNHCQLTVNVTGTINVRRSGNTLGTTTNAMSPDVWYHVALEYNIHDTTGFYELRVNNTNWLSDTAQDTLEAGGPAEVGHVVLSGTGSEWNARVCQPILWSATGDAPTDFFGPHKIWTLRPTGDSATADFTPKGAGANYVEVDEVEVDDDTTYNESSTATDTDRLALEDLPESPDTIYAVQARTCVKQTEAGTLGLKTGVYSGTTEDDNGGIVPGLSYEFHTHLMTENPDDTAAWEEADVNALQVQYEAV